MCKFVKTIFGGVLGGLLGTFFAYIIFATSDNIPEKYGNLADWLSGIGSIGAILAVWWQSRQEKKLLKLQLENEKEQAFQQKRQLFKLNINNCDNTKDKLSYLPMENLKWSSDLQKITMFDEIVKAQTDVVQISNISDKDLIAVRVIFIYSEHEVARFNIDSVKPHSQINLINYLKENLYREFDELVSSEIPQEKMDSKMLIQLEDIWKNQRYFYDIEDQVSKNVVIDDYDKLSKAIDNLFKNSDIKPINKSKQIIVYYMTSMREKIRLVFEQNDKGIFYKKNLNMLEHRDGWTNKKGQEKFNKFDDEYNLNNFQESRRFNR